jgi:hypothetical protein
MPGHSAVPGLGGRAGREGSTWTMARRFRTSSGICGHVVESGVVESAVTAGAQHEGQAMQRLAGRTEAPCIDGR